MLRKTSKYLPGYQMMENILEMHSVPPNPVLSPTMSEVGSAQTVNTLRYLNTKMYLWCTPWCYLIQGQSPTSKLQNECYPGGLRCIPLSLWLPILIACWETPFPLRCSYALSRSGNHDLRVFWGLKTLKMLLASGLTQSRMTKFFVLTCGQSCMEIWAYSFF